MIRSCPISLACLLAAATGLAQQAVPVVRPARTGLQQQTRLPSRVLPEQRLALRARATGFLAEIPVDHGSKVVQGDLLARLDVPDLEAALRAAEAALAEAEADIDDATAKVRVAEADIERAAADITAADAGLRIADLMLKRRKTLLAKNGATQEDVDEAQGRVDEATARLAVARAAMTAAEARLVAARSGIKSAEARRDSRRVAVEAARTQLGFAELRCPFPQAIVARRHLDPGELVRSGETVLLELQRTDRLRVEVPVPEREAVFVSIGTDVDLRFDAKPSANRSATVSRTAGSLTEAGLMTAQIDLDNGDGALMPGMFVYVDLLLTQKDSALTLPAAALLVGTDGKPYVFVVEGTTARRRAVRLGADNGIRVEVIEGVGPEDRVVSGVRVEDGATVRPVEPEKGR